MILRGYGASTVPLKTASRRRLTIKRCIFSFGSWWRGAPTGRRVRPVRGPGHFPDAKNDAGRGAGRRRTRPRTGAGPAPDRAPDAGRRMNWSRTPPRTGPRTSGRAGRRFPDGPGLGPGRRNSRRTPDGAQRTAPDATPDGENVPDGPGRDSTDLRFDSTDRPGRGPGRRDFSPDAADGRFRTRPGPAPDEGAGTPGRDGRWGPLGLGLLLSHSMSERKIECETQRKSSRVSR